MDQMTKNRIVSLLTEVMERVLTRVCKEPLSEEDLLRTNPFGARLAPSEIWKGSKFERSFVTTLGQGVFEQVAKIIAQGSGAMAYAQHQSQLTVCTFRLERIGSLLKSQRESKVTPNWEREVADLLALQNDRREDVNVISDLHIIQGTGEREFYTLKTVKPNLDQTEIAKRDMMRLLAYDEGVRVFFSLPYNPAGEGNPYRMSGHTVPYKLFDMDTDPCVLIGSRFWNHVGSSETVYEELLSVFEHVGARFTQEIRNRYLGL